MTKKYFPIQTETACRLKWSWSTVYLTTGRTASCHRASWADLTEDNFMDFHNLPPKIAARESMLRGEWPTGGCEYCRDVEELGEFSDRMYQLMVPDAYPPELDNDPTLTWVDPTMVEIFFQNTCHLSCIYCTERYSSTIERENLKYGKIPILGDRGELPANNYEALVPLIWKWLEGNSSKLRRLHILGGEPLIQQDFDKLLDFLETHPNPNLELCVITSLMIKDKRLDDCIQKLKKLCAKRKIQKVDLAVSVDSWGPGQEYIRYGFDCDVIDKNIKRLMAEPWLKIRILTTISSLSIPETPELWKKIKEWSTYGKIDWLIYSILPYKEHILSPHAFDYSQWAQYLDPVHEEMQDKSFDEYKAKHILKGIIGDLKNSSYSAKMHGDLITYLDEIDRRRGLDWSKTFTWLTRPTDVV